MNLVRKYPFDIKTSSIKNLVSLELIFQTIKIRKISTQKVISKQTVVNISLIPNILSLAHWYLLFFCLWWTRTVSLAGSVNPTYATKILTQTFFIFELIWNLWKLLSGCQRGSSHSPYMGALPLHTNTTLWLGSWLASPLHAVVENLECCLLYLCTYWLTKKF